MPGTVLDKSDEAEALTFRMSEKSVYSLDHNLDEIDILPFVEAADIVGLSVLAFVENQVDGAGVILDIEPVTYILAFSIDRKRLSLAYIVDEQGYEFFRELIRAVIVGTVRDHDRHSVSIVK